MDVKHLLTALALAAMAPWCAHSASATVIELHAPLLGSGEVPPNASPASGFAELLLDPTGNTLEIDITFSGLLGTTTASHIHCCLLAPFDSANAPVATTVPTFVGFPFGVTSGTYHTILDLALASSYNPSFLNNATNMGVIANAEATLVDALLTDRTYLNIHTTVFPGGEIRGILQVPEPTTLALLALGAGAAVMARKRSRPRS